MNTLTGRLGPREVALALAFGVLLGLLPKANLLFAVLALAFFFSRANLVFGVCVAIVVSLFAPWVHPFCDRIGGTVLTSPPGQQWLGKLFQLPLAPWTMLDNTLVLGSFLLGLVLFFSLFLVSWGVLKIVWPKRKEEKPSE